MTSRNMSTAWLPYDVYIVYIWMMEIKSRVESMMSEHINIACWP